MKIHKLHIKSPFKNLENFIFESNSSKQIQVIVGLNGTGKSNFLEALSLIFANLYYSKGLQKNEDFSYKLEYEYNNKNVRVVSERNTKPKFLVDNQEITQWEFLENKSSFLPKHLITYYSGFSKRLESVFDKFKKEQTREFKGNSENPFMPIFYMQDRHSKLAFLTCMAFSDKEFSTLLNQSLGIVSLEEVVFTFKIPYWAKSKVQKEEKFWATDGIMRKVLESIEKYGFQNEEIEKEYILSLSDIQKLAQDYLQQNEVDEKPELRFFQALESLYWSDLVENIQIKVKRANSIMPISELSEGEVQLLLVLGFIGLFRNKECLFLLDEPDTHLNPMWKYHYLYYLREIAGQSPKSQILMTSHEALVVNGLKKENIKIFKRNSNGEVVSVTPEKDMIGLSMEEILTSDTFGLTTVIDRETYQKVLRKREIYGLLRSKKRFSEEEKKKLQQEVREIEDYLDPFGL